MIMQDKKIKGVRVLSHRQVLSISYLGRWPPDHISDVKPLFHSTHYEQSLCNLEAMLYLKILMHVNPLQNFEKIKKIPGFVGR